MKLRFRQAFLLLFLVTFLGSLSAQNASQGTKKQPQPPVSDPLPRSDSDQQSSPPIGSGESSSKETQIDISPPKDDATKHPDSDVDDVTEMHVFNPHKAEKDIEIGEFYMKRKNYVAAESRFREALVYKPGDAIAIYRLAETLEAQEDYGDAVTEYREYLKIPSNGKFTSEAKKALARLEKNSAQK